MKVFKSANERRTFLHFLTGCFKWYAVRIVCVYLFCSVNRAVNMVDFFFLFLSAVGMPRQFYSLNVWLSKDLSSNFYVETTTFSTRVPTTLGRAQKEWEEKRGKRKKKCNNVSRHKFLQQLRVYPSMPACLPGIQVESVLRGTPAQSYRTSSWL